MGGLTTHVLDTAAGKPASGLEIELWRFGPDGPQHLKTVETNSDGRSPSPLLEGEDFAAGEYELRFHTGAYLRSAGHDIADPPFLDVVPVRFGVSEPSSHYHVPLLISPYGYSTYRGS